MRIYCDSVILIYYFEGQPSFKARARARLAALAAAGDVIVVSDLSRLECRSMPLGAGDVTLVADYDRFFAGSNVESVPISTAVFDRATLLRAAHRFKTVDALHLAAAIEGGCDRFLTNDVKLKACTDIPVELLP
jgi:predicted nucleic acid-binding protein